MVESSKSLIAFFLRVSRVKRSFLFNAGGDLRDNLRIG